MNGFHPNAKRAAVCALTALVAVGGCRSSSSVATNPFMGPDRVTPPSTRMLAPGQAQPYYQGDPLPVMQSSAPPAPAGPLAADSTSRTESGKTLAWNAPAATTSSPSANMTQSVAPTAPRPASPWDRPATQPTSIAAAGEPPVAVPTDVNDLRFDLPVAAAATTPQTAATNLSPSSAATAPLNTSVPPGTQATPGVALASYNSPSTTTNTGGLTPITTTPALAPATAATSPWQKPQLAGATQPLGYAAQPSLTYPICTPASVLSSQPIYTQPQQPIALPTNTMAVDLRSVPSPAPQPGDPMPRVRIPGYEVPQTTNTDGFRPRTSMR